MHDARSHFAPDELDLWLEGRLPEHRTSHLETCERCRSQAEETRELVLQLALLPKASPPDRFIERVMARVSLGHLSADELDLWIDGLLPAPREAHLQDCLECRELADAERVLALRLKALPLFSPAVGFSERVLDGVELPLTSFSAAWRRWRTRVVANPAGIGIAAGVAVVLGGSLAASAAWAAAHQETITGVGTWFVAQGRQLFWQGLGSATALLQEQPWYASLRGSLTPLRIAALAGAGAAMYAAGLLALRRLLTPPSAEVARALP